MCKINEFNLLTNHLNFKYTAKQGACRYDSSKNLGIKVTQKLVSSERFPNETAILDVNFLYESVFMNISVLN
jgi:hypothetical protein